MNELDRLLNSVRARIVLRDIANGVERRMPCGDMRLVERMRAFGGVRLTDPKRREVTNAWKLTDLGKEKLKNVC